MKYKYIFKIPRSPPMPNGGIQWGMKKAKKMMTKK